MPLHDIYARRTPFELAVPDRTAIPELIEKVVEEARAGGADPSHMHAFVTMGSVTSFVNALQGDDAPSEAIHQYGALLYHAVHFEEDGHPLFLVDTHACRYLVEGAPDGSPTPPTESGYLQFPQHLFWIGSEGDATPESIDGLFWTVSASGLLHSLLVTGVRPDRAGFGTVPIPEAPLSEAPQWVDAQARPEGDDFASAMPGADVEGLYSVETAGEVLKLLSRFFAYVSNVPEAVRLLDPSDPEDASVPPSDLPYRRVGLA